jgi:DNA (cytosine-5)-methyltransferase 1
MKYFSMFSGIGGFELGIQRAHNNKQLTEIEQDGERRNGDFNEQEVLLRPSKNTPLCVGYSEIDKYASAVYRYRFGKEVKNYRDATKINTEELPDFDLLVGGFPCQAFSIAGKRRGFEDTRGTLFFEIARVLKAKQPRMFLLENVKGLLNHDKGETFTQILRAIDELGYDAEWQVLNSKHFGVPQNRERVFIIGRLRGTGGRKVFPLGTTNKIFDEEKAISCPSNINRGNR